MIGVGVLLWIDRRFTIRRPALFALYVAWYTTFRTFEEILRIDPSNHFLHMRINFWVSLGVWILRGRLLHLVAVLPRAVRRSPCRSRGRCRQARAWPSRRAASGNAATRPRVIVRELELDLDAFEGPFDLLLTLVLKDELDLRDVDLAGIVLAFLERLAEREELDLEACGEFLVLIAALLELKARALFPDEAAELAELDPEEAAEELARRLAEYRRVKEAAAWLRERLAAEGDRYFRLGPAPLAPKVETPLAPQDPEALALVLRVLAQEPPQVSLSHMALRFPPVSQFLERFRAVLRRRSRFDFDTEVGELTRLEQASAFLALLELRRSGELAIEQAAPFAPIRVSRLAQETNAQQERTAEWTVRSA